MKKIKIMNIINGPIWVLYLVWETYLLVTYMCAMHNNPDANLSLNADASFINWCINLVFIIDLAVNAAVNIIKGKRAREK